MFLPPRPEEKSLRGRTLYIPRVLDHMVVFKAALEREGYAVELLPPTSREALERGRAWSSGRECNPFAYILGDLIALTRRPDFRPEKSAFFINSTVGPCLLSQFARGFELAMHELGWEGMLVDDPPGEAFKRRFRLPTLVRLWEGLVAVEVLGRLLAEYRPSEKSLGAADAVHQENLRDLENAVRRGQVAGSLIRARERLQAVCGPPDTERPLIAVVGDIFTRVNPVANARLHQRIEALGCRVLPPPTFTDTAWHDAGEDLLNHLRQGKTLKAVEDALLAALQFAVAERLQRGARLDGAKLPLRDWSWWKVDKKLSGLLTHEVDSILAMNVALALDAATQGAAAVINAICHNCMIGTVSAAVLQRCARKAGMPPMVTLAFDGLQETNTDTRLEALCQRALWSRRKGKVHE